VTPASFSRRAWSSVSSPRQAHTFRSCFSRTARTASSTLPNTRSPGVRPLMTMQKVPAFSSAARPAAARIFSRASMGYFSISAALMLLCEQ